MERSQKWGRFFCIEIIEKIVDTYNISIYNQVGQPVYTSQQVADGDNNSPRINIEKLQTGIYFAKIVTSSTKVYQSKFEVIR